MNTNSTGGGEAALGACGAPYCGGNGRSCILPAGHEGDEHRTATGLRWPVAGHPGGPVEDVQEVEVRAALRVAAGWISYAAGTVAAADPEQARRLMAAADEAAGYLARTGGTTVETGATR